MLLDLFDNFDGDTSIRIRFQMNEDPMILIEGIPSQYMPSGEDLKIDFLTIEKVSEDFRQIPSIGIKLGTNAILLIFSAETVFDFFSYSPEHEYNCMCCSALLPNKSFKTSNIDSVVLRFNLPNEGDETEGRLVATHRKGKISIIDETLINRGLLSELPGFRELEEEMECKIR